MKRILMIFICVTLALSLMLAGCGASESQPGESVTEPQDDAATTEPQEQDSDESIMTNAGEFPIVKEGNDVTLSLTVRATAMTDDYDNNEFTKWFEEETGVSFDFTVLPAVEYRQRLNIMMAGGDYTDMIMGFDFSLAEQQLYASQGILIPLDEMIEKYGVETQKAFAEFPEYDIKGLFSLLDGQLYTLPNLVECYHCAVSGKMWIYRPWLDELGLDMPTTTEEFYEVLKAFKEDDPNRNGLADEIPLAASPRSWNGKIDIFLMNAFIRNDGVERLTLNDGRVDVAYNKPEWKEGLQYLNKLYSEGLIAPESFTQDGEQLRLLAENPDTPILGAAPGGVMPAQIMGESGRWLEFEAVPALEGPNGVQEVSLYRYIGNESSTYITDKCEYPEIAFRVADALYNDDIFYRAQFGRPDKEWRMAEEGELGLDGNQGIFKQIISVNEMDKNITWYQQVHEKQPLSFRFGRVIEDNPLEQILYEASRDKYYRYAADIDTTTIPNLIFSEDQASELVDLETTLMEYVEEMIGRFVTGDVDIDAGWDDYLNQLKSMNLDRYLQIYQEAYDARP